MSEDIEDKFYMYLDPIRNVLVFPNLPADWEPDPEDVAKTHAEIVDNINEVPFNNFDPHCIYLVLDD